MTQMNPMSTKKIKTLKEALSLLQEAWGENERLTQQMQGLRTKLDEVVQRGIDHPDIVRKLREELDKAQKELASANSTMKYHSERATEAAKEIEVMHRTFDLVPGILPQVERDEKETWRDKNYNLMQRFVSYLLVQNHGPKAIKEATGA